MNIRAHFTTLCLLLTAACGGDGLSPGEPWPLSEEPLELNHLRNAKEIPQNVSANSENPENNTPERARRGITTGWEHTCALVHQKAWCWGSNKNGQIGDGTTEDRLLPTAVDLPGLAQQISAGADAISCALVQGAVYCWGGWPTVGDDNWVQRLRPTLIQGLEQDVTAISAGYASVCAIQNGKARCFGSNYHGQLGNGGSYSEGSGSAVDVVSIPDTIETIATGTTRVCALTNKGAVYCWGSSFDDELDEEGVRKRVPKPILMEEFAQGVRQMSMRADTVCAIIDDELIRCRGELLEEWQLPRASKVFSGKEELCVIRGDNSSIECIDTNRQSEQWVLHSTRGSFDAFSGPGDHSCLLRGQDVYCQGANAHGQLGSGRTTLHPRYSKVPIP